MRFLRRILRVFRRRRWQYNHLVHVLIDGDRIVANFDYFQRRHPDCSIVPVLKSNAYGHGLALVAHEMENAKAFLPQISVPFFAVDSYHEALILRNEGIRTPILIIGYSDDANILSSHLKDVAWTISSIEQFRSLLPLLRRETFIHCKIDTGMHRQGIAPDEISEALELVRKTPLARLDGVCSHFADADTPDSELTRAQINAWNAHVAQIRAAVGDIRWRHISATAGHRYASLVDANMIRLGLGLYGYSNDPLEDAAIRPALEMLTYITQLRDLPAGERIGYNGTYTTEAPLRLATIPVGYAEGLDRRLSNKGSVLVHGVACPIVGRISMNMATIDVSAVPDVQPQDEVVVISAQKNALNSAGEMARLCDTIPYDMLVRIPSTLSRVRAVF